MVADVLAEANSVPRVLGALELTGLGVGGIIGTGIFIMTGIAAHEKAGPALAVSLVIAAIVAIACALCYAELAAAIPRAGSAYTYASVTLGRAFGWLVGWNLALQYGLAAASVAQGWSHYFQNTLGMFGVQVPSLLSGTPLDLDPAVGKLVPTGCLFDLPALLIIALITTIVVRGIRPSMAFNLTMLVVKLGIILFVIVVGLFYIHPHNWTPFAPYGWSGLTLFGKPVLGHIGNGGEPTGVLAGAALVFYAYLGFDAITAYTPEARHPQRDIPRAIVATMAIAMTLYIAVTVVLTGMVRYDAIDVRAPLSNAFSQVGLPWAQLLIAVGATAGITSVLLIILLTYPRILVAICNDGLISRKFFAAIHPRYQTPWKSAVVVGIVTALLGALVPLRVLADLVILGTLFGFVLIALCVLRLRQTEIGKQTPFRAPFGPLVPILSIGSCLLLMAALPGRSWAQLVLWLLSGVLLYLIYGRHRTAIVAS